MNKFIISTLIVCILSAASIAMADTKTVTINWSTSGITDSVERYKMIYSYSSDMASPVDACQTNDNSVNFLTCQNVELTERDVYFQIVAITNEPTSIESNIQHVEIPLGPRLVPKNTRFSP